VVTSTLAAISLTPMLSSKLLSLKERTKKTGRFSYENTIEVFLNKMDDVYVASLRWVLEHKKLVATLSVAIFLSSLFLVKYIGTDFMPESDESRISAAIELQTGTRVEETVKTARNIEKLIKEKYPEIKLVATSSGSDDEGSMFSLFTSSGSNMINFMMRLSDVDDRERQPDGGHSRF